MINYLRDSAARSIIRMITPRAYVRWSLVAAIGSLLFLQAADVARAQENHTFVLDQESRIWVEGTSTIHDWSCEVLAFTGEISIGANAQKPLTAIRGTRLTIPVEKMECGKSKMNRKLQDAFGAGKNPDIIFEMQAIDAESEPEGSGSPFPLVVNGHLTMAGTTRTINVKLEAYERADSRLEFVGTHALDMTDYEMDPPTALLGSIRTAERVVVHFELWGTHQQNG